MRLKSPNTFLLFLLFISAVFLSVPAQNTLNVNVETGLTGLYGFSNPFVGGRVGADFQATLSNQFGLSIGMGYFNPAARQKSSIVTGGGIGKAVHTATLRMHMIDLEALAKVRIGEKVTLAIGPYFGYQFRTNIKHHFVFTDNAGESQSVFSANLTAEFEQFDFGFRPQIGYQINKVLSARFTYSQGLRQLYLSEPRNTSHFSQAIMVGLNWELFQF